MQPPNHHNYLAQILAEGTKPFRYRSRVRALLGLSNQKQPTQAMIKGNLPPVGFRYTTHFMPFERQEHLLPPNVDNGSWSRGRNMATKTEAMSTAKNQNAAQPGPKTAEPNLGVEHVSQPQAQPPIENNLLDPKFDSSALPTLKPESAAQSLSPTSQISQPQPQSQRITENNLLNSNLSQYKGPASSSLKHESAAQSLPPTSQSQKKARNVSKHESSHLHSASIEKAQEIASGESKQRNHLSGPKTSTLMRKKGPVQPEPATQKTVPVITHSLPDAAPLNSAQQNATQPITETTSSSPVSAEPKTRTVEPVKITKLKIPRAKPESVPQVPQLNTAINTQPKSTSTNASGSEPKPATSRVTTTGPTMVTTSGEGPNSKTKLAQKSTIAAPVEAQTPSTLTRATSQVDLAPVKTTAIVPPVETTLAKTDLAPVKTTAIVPPVETTLAKTTKKTHVSKRGNQLLTTPSNQDNSTVTLPKKKSKPAANSNVVSSQKSPPQPTFTTRILRKTAKPTGLPQQVKTTSDQTRTSHRVETTPNQKTAQLVKTTPGNVAKSSNLTNSTVVLPKREPRGTSKKTHQTQPILTTKTTRESSKSTGTDHQVKTTLANTQVAGPSNLVNSTVVEPSNSTVADDARHVKTGAMPRRASSRTSQTQPTLTTKTTTKSSKSTGTDHQVKTTLANTQVVGSSNLANSTVVEPSNSTVADDARHVKTEATLGVKTPPAQKPSLAAIPPPLKNSKTFKTKAKALDSQNRMEYKALALDSQNRGTEESKALALDSQNRGTEKSKTLALNLKKRMESKTLALNSQNRVTEESKALALNSKNQMESKTLALNSQNRVTEESKALALDSQNRIKVLNFQNRVDAKSKALGISEETLTRQNQPTLTTNDSTNSTNSTNVVVHTAQPMPAKAKTKAPRMADTIPVKKQDLSALSSSLNKSTTPQGENQTQSTLTPAFAPTMITISSTPSDLDGNDENRTSQTPHHARFPEETEFELNSPKLVPATRIEAKLLKNINSLKKAEANTLARLESVIHQLHSKQNTLATQKKNSDTSSNRPASERKPTIQRTRQPVMVIKQRYRDIQPQLPAAFWERSYLSRIRMRNVR